MSSLQQIANWKSQVNPLEKVYGGGGICPAIVARPQTDNAMMILVSTDFDEPYKDLRELYKMPKNIQPGNGIYLGQSEKWGMTNTLCQIAPTIKTQACHMGVICDAIVPESSREGTNMTSMNRDTREIRCMKAGTLEGGEYEHELDKNKRAYSTDGASPTIIATTDQKIVEEIKIFDAYNHREISDKGMVGTLTAATNHGSANSGTFYVGEPPHYRIRKLTEKECFRLMGVKDEDSSQIAQYQSKTSQNHLAGDSIVTACLMAIFGEMCGSDWRSSIDSLVESLTQHSIETEGDVNEYLRGAK